MEGPASPTNLRGAGRLLLGCLAALSGQQQQYVRAWCRGRKPEMYLSGMIDHQMGYDVDGVPIALFQCYPCHVITKTTGLRAVRPTARPMGRHLLSLSADHWKVKKMERQTQRNGPTASRPRRLDSGTTHDTSQDWRVQQARFVLSEVEQYLQPVQYST